MTADSKMFEGRQATAAPFAIRDKRVRSCFAFALFVGATSVTQALAEPLLFDCEWLESSPPYKVQFQIDVEGGTAARSDSDTAYTVLSANDRAVWLLQKDTSDRMIAIATISRSANGRNWTDTQLLADGEALEITGGFCVERTP